MYDHYLEIYNFAIAMPYANFDSSRWSDADRDKVLFIEHLSKRYLYTYIFTYLLIYGTMFLPYLWLSPEEFYQGMDVVFYRLSICVFTLVSAITHGYVIYRNVRNYHKTSRTKVYKNGKPSYDEVYPKELRRKLRWLNVLPFAYLTFAVTPLLTRIQYLIGARMGSQTQQSRLIQHELLKNRIFHEITGSDLDRAEQLKAFRMLFERRISEIVADRQRIPIILSSLGITISIIGAVVKDPIQMVFKTGNLVGMIVFVSFLSFVSGIVIYFVGRLQIQTTLQRDLSLVLDTIDIMLVDSQRESQDH